MHFLAILPLSLSFTVAKECSPHPPLRGPPSPLGKACSSSPLGTYGNGTFAKQKPTLNTPLFNPAFMRQSHSPHPLTKTSREEDVIVFPMSSFGTAKEKKKHRPAGGASPSPTVILTFRLSPTKNILFTSPSGEISHRRYITCRQRPISLAEGEFQCSTAGGG